MAINKEDRERLYRQFKHSLGAPLRIVEVRDDMLDTFIEMAIEDYAQYVQEWLIEHQWLSLLGQNIDTTDMAFALSVRSTDFVSQYTYAYSKLVGLQSNGPWELKKDFIRIEHGRQVYEIPAGREVNQVLWMTPPAMTEALFANFGGMDYGFGGGFAQTGAVGGGGGGLGGGGRSGYYIAPAFDILLTASDMSLKNRLLRSDLVYKITAGANGTKLLHLLSTPGSSYSFGNGVGGVANAVNMTGCQVWYHYYDTTSDNVDQCRADNPDIIKMPNEVPLPKLDYSSFNEPTKILIRQLFIALGKMTLGRVRGKFGGIVGPPESQQTMDWESLMTEGNQEKKEVLDRLDARLLRLSSTEQLKRSSEEATYLNTSMKYRPLGMYVI